MNPSQNDFALRFDSTNPGQFLACCGLLELADRSWNGAEAWFDGPNTFRLRASRPVLHPAPGELLSALAKCSIMNTMTPQELQRRDELAARSKEVKDDPLLKAEKKALDALWRESPILFGTPFSLRVDWFTDDRADGAIFKTWAGQQSVLEIARGMQSALRREAWRAISVDAWLTQSAASDGLPFNFDSELGALGSDRDVGFSFDPLKHINVLTKPCLELCAFIGLQRFRPRRTGKNRFRYATWDQPMLPQVASVAACALLPDSAALTFEFGLHYRTQYLKSFLPAKPVGR